MQKTTPYQDEDDMKNVTSENTLYLILVIECKRQDHILIYQYDNDMKT